MKIKDIKGELGSRIRHAVTEEINELMFLKIKENIPEIKFRDGFFFGNMENFKKFLSGKPLGFRTHGYTGDESPDHCWGIPQICSTYCETPPKPEKTSFDIDTDTMHIEIDLESETGHWWKLWYSVKAKKAAILESISRAFDSEIVKGDSVKHFDMLGREIRIGDVICYSTTISNNVWLGTVEKFNDCSLVADGSQIPYDTTVLVVTGTVFRDTVTGGYVRK